MKRSLFCGLFVAAFAAFSHSVPAQEAPASVAAVKSDSASKSPEVTGVAQVPVAPRSLAEVSSLGVAPTINTSASIQGQSSEGGVKNFFFGTRRRSSNTLLIGGVALAGIGVGVVKGEVGAVLGVMGLISTIGGLYLAF
jgi:hypothetical protein